jgi:hypothetical protein
VGEGFEEMLQGLQRTFLPPTPTFIVINNFKEEEVEVRVAEPKVSQHVKPK